MNIRFFCNNVQIFEDKFDDLIICLLLFQYSLTEPQSAKNCTISLRINFISGNTLSFFLNHFAFLHLVTDKSNRNIRPTWNVLVNCYSSCPVQPVNALT